MPKPEILDPQGQAIQKALGRMGFDTVSEVRQGKRFEVEVDGELDAAALAKVEQMAETLLANTVIEEFTVRIESDSTERGTSEGDKRTAGSAS